MEAAVMHSAQTQVQVRTWVQTDPTPEPDPSAMVPWYVPGFGRGGQGEPFLVLQAEELPPDGVQAAEGLWGMVTLSGEPIAFVSPDVVSNLPADQPVGALFDDLHDAYVAQFSSDPRNFFQAQLGAGVRGPVFVLDRGFADANQRIRVTDLAFAKCDRGQIVGIGKFCDDQCQCGRREQK